jgi:hypothetical protein
MASATAMQAHRQAGRYRVQLHMVLRCGPTHEAEMILMVDFSSTQAQAKEVAPLLAVRGPG